MEIIEKDLKKFDKPSQALYSHLLDAQVAFCMALQEHQMEGSLKLNLQKNKLGLWSRIDQKTGEVKTDKKGRIYDNSLFNLIPSVRKRV